MLYYKLNKIDQKRIQLDQAQIAYREAVFAAIQLIDGDKLWPRLSEKDREFLTEFKKENCHDD